MNFFRNKNKITKISNSSLIITLKDGTIQVSIYIPKKKESLIESRI